MSSAVPSKKAEYDELGPFFTADYFSSGAIRLRKKETREIKLDEFASNQTCQGCCYRISMNSWFQWFFGLLTIGAVSFNLWLIDFALQTRANGEVHDTHTADTVYRARLASVILTILFVIEVVIRLTGSPVRAWRDGWLLFDTIVTLCAALDDFVLYDLLGKASSGLPAFRAIKIFRVFRAARFASMFRRCPNVKVITQTLTDNLLRASWLLIIVGALSWCLAIVLTVVVGAGIIPSAENLGATSAREFFSVKPLLDNMGGSLLLLMLIPLRVFRWGPLLLWPLLTAESVSLNVTGVVLLLYIVLFLSSMVHIIVAVFMSSVVEAAGQDMQQRNIDKMHATGITCASLADMFEEAVKTNQRRCMTLGTFRQVMRDNEVVGNALCGAVEEEKQHRKHIDAVFRELDKSLTHSLDISEFVIGIAKLTRVVPELNFLQIDGQQTMTIRQTSQTSDVYTSLMIAMYRRVRELKLDCKQLNRCMHSLRDNASNARRILSNSPSHIGFTEQRNREPLKKKLQDRCNFTSRLDAAKRELSKARRPPWINSELKQAVASVTDSLLQEDLLPWLQENIQRNVLIASRNADLQKATWQDVSMTQTRTEAVVHTQKRSTMPEIAIAKSYRSKFVPCIPDPVFATSFVSGNEKLESPRSCQSAEEDEVILFSI